MIIKELERFFKKREPVLFLLSILSVVLPGYAVIFVLDFNLFLQLDWVKLVLLSATITFPLIFVNTLAIPSIKEEDSGDQTILAHSFGLASVMTGCVYFATLVPHHFFFTTLNEYLGLLFFGEAVLLFTVWNEHTKKKKKSILVPSD